MKTVAAFSTPTEAHLAIARLAGSGVKAFIRDENAVVFNWLISNAIGGVKVEVDEDDWTEARAILALPPSDDGMILCPHCGSRETKVRVLSVFGAVCMILKLPFPQTQAAVDCMTCKKSHCVSIDGRT